MPPIDTESNSKKIIYSVYKFLKDLSRKSDLTADFFLNAQQVTAQACGISIRTVGRVCHEATTIPVDAQRTDVPCLKSLRRSYKRSKTLTELDDFGAERVRRIVYDFYNRGEYPTAASIFYTYRKISNYTGSISSMRRILKNLNFTFKKCKGGQKCLVEHTDIVALRFTFLKKMFTLRQNNDSRPVVYVTRYGFIKDSKLVFRLHTSNTADYHVQMDAKMYREWFLQLLINLEEPCIIVLDNISYHSTLDENYPKSSSKKSNVQKWVTNNDVSNSPLEMLTEPKIKVKNTMPNEMSNYLDQVALEKGHEVLRIPPNHCQYNPIKLIWTHVKNEVSKNSDTLNMADIERLTYEELFSVTMHDWKICVQQATSIQTEDYEKEIQRDIILKPIIQTILPDDNNLSENEDT